jgi:hypothetical protein
MPLPAPPPLPDNPIARIRSDLRYERAARRHGPGLPGSKLPSVTATRRFRNDPLSLLLSAYEEHGPIFGIRLLHSYQVFMIGPEANHFVLVSDRDKFR